MKKEIVFLNNNGIYEFKLEEELIFSINSQDLQLDVKAFYDAFFDNDDYENYKFINSITENRKAKRVFECVEKLYTEVVAKLREEGDDIG